jgi:hypothetical protein
MEFGFLAIARDGGYLQVNGSVIQRLNRGDVDAAIHCAEQMSSARPVLPPTSTLTPVSPSAMTMTMASAAGPVTVIRKKRRTPADIGVAP